MRGRGVEEKGRRGGENRSGGIGNREKEEE